MSLPLLWGAPARRPARTFTPDWAARHVATQQQRSNGSDGPREVVAGYDVARMTHGNDGNMLSR